MSALTLAIALALLALAALAVKRVPLGQVYSLYRHGKQVRLLRPGTHVVLPLVERVRHRINLNGQVLRFEQPLADAGDVHGTVYWQVLEPERADAVIEQVDQLIRRGAQLALQPEAVSAHKPDLAPYLKQALNNELRQRGMLVTRVELDIA